MKRIKTIGCIVGSLLPFVLGLPSCMEQVFDNQDTIPIVQKALYDTSSVYYADFKAFPAQMDTLPIGIVIPEDEAYTMAPIFNFIDVFNNVTGKDTPDGIPDFAGENYQVLLDRANGPYADYIASHKENYLREIVVKNAIFLLSNKYYLKSSDKVAKGEKSRCKIVILASISTGAYGYKDVEQMLKLSGTDIKVVGLVRSSIKSLFEHLQQANTQDSVSVGVLGEEKAVESYESLIESYQKQINYNHFIQIVHPAKDSLNLDTLSLIQKARIEIESILENLRQSPQSAPLKSIILTDANYLPLKKEMEEIIEDYRNVIINGRNMYAWLIAPDFNFVYPLESAAKECYMALRDANLLAFNPDDSKVELYISVPNYTVDTENLDENGNLKKEFLLGRQVGKEEETTVVIPYKLD